MVPMIKLNGTNETTLKAANVREMLVSSNDRALPLVILYPILTYFNILI
jgi:hypothetical protein